MNSKSDDYVGLALFTGFFAGAILVGVAANYDVHSSGANKAVAKARTELAELRISQRKSSSLAADERKKAFVRDIVPQFQLAKGTLDYRVLETACMSGIYGSKVDDFAVNPDKVKTTYTACGWVPRNY